MFYDSPDYVFAKKDGRSMMSSMVIWKFGVGMCAEISVVHVWNFGGCEILENILKDCYCVIGRKGWLCGSKYELHMPLASQIMNIPVFRFS